MESTTTHPNRLRALREAQGVSREQMAVHFGVLVGAIQYWEKVNIPSQRLVEVARYFGVSTDWLLGAEGSEAAA